MLVVTFIATCTKGFVYSCRRRGLLDLGHCYSMFRFTVVFAYGKKTSFWVCITIGIAFAFILFLDELLLLLLFLPLLYLSSSVSCHSLRAKGRLIKLARLVTRDSILFLRGWR